MGGLCSKAKNDTAPKIEAGAIGNVSRQTGEPSGVNQKKQEVLAAAEAEAKKKQDEENAKKLLKEKKNQENLQKELEMKKNLTDN